MFCRTFNACHLLLIYLFCKLILDYEKRNIVSVISHSVDIPHFYLTPDVKKRQLETEQQQSTFPTIPIILIFKWKLDLAVTLWPIFQVWDRIDRSKVSTLFRVEEPKTTPYPGARPSIGHMGK